MIKKHEFNSYCAGKHIAVVGNSKAILDRRDGALIDRHDIVIRFNAGWPRKPEATGTRTDVWSCAIANREIKAQGHQYFRNRKYTVWSWPSLKHLPQEFRPTTFHFPAKIFKRLKSLTGTVPTNGSLMLYYILSEISYKSLTLAGFDFYHNPPVYLPDGGFPGRYQMGHHDIRKEEAFMLKLLMHAQRFRWLV